MGDTVCIKIYGDICICMFWYVKLTNCCEVDMSIKSYLFAFVKKITLFLV